MQEVPENSAPGQLPRTVDVIAEDDLVDSCKPGDRVAIVGIYKALPGKSKGSVNGVFRTVLIANNVSLLNKEANAPIYSPEDLKNIKKIAEREDTFDLLGNSLAPSIHGHSWIKKAVMLLMLGGVEKNLKNDTHLRGITDTCRPEADAYPVNEGAQSFPDGSNNNVYMKNTPLSSNSMGGQNSLLQTSGSQLLGRSAASPSAATSATSFDNTTASPIPYANSPRSSTNIMNTPSPQQQTPQLQQQQPTTQQQQRQKMMQQSQQQQQQILAQQQQFRQSTMQGLGQLHGQHQMQFSPQLGHQQFQSRQLSSAHMQHGIGQTQLNQGNQMNRLSQFSGHANSALFSAAQTTPNTQMIPNISAGITSQSLLPRMQYGLSGNNPQRSHPSQMLSDQMFNMGGGNPGGMMSIQQQQQQQQHSSQGAFGGMASNAQNLQSGMMTLQNAQQNHPNFSQQRQQNPQ